MVYVTIFVRHPSPITVSHNHTQTRPPALAIELKSHFRKIMELCCPAACMWAFLQIFKRNPRLGSRLNRVDRCGQFDLRSWMLMCDWERIREGVSCKLTHAHMQNDLPHEAVIGLNISLNVFHIWINSFSFASQVKVSCRMTHTQRTADFIHWLFTL